MARILYSVAFDISDTTLNLGTITLDIASFDPIVFTLGSLTASLPSITTFLHLEAISFSVVKQDGSDTVVLPQLCPQTLGGRLGNRLRLLATNAGWPNASNLGLVFDVDTGLYTIGFTGGSGDDVSIAWSTAEGRRLFGFAADVSATAETHTGTRIPWFVIRPTLTAVSNPTHDREVDGVASAIVNDEGTAVFGAARSGGAVERDWVQQFEPVAKCEPINADSSHPFTHRDLFNHCRKGFPFAVLSGGFGNELSEVFALRAEGSSWRAPFATPNRSHIRNVEYQTYVMGAIDGV